MTHFRLGLDRLESRLLFARSNDVLFDFEFEGHQSEWHESLSDVHFANDQYFAWANDSSKDAGRFVVIDSTTHEIKGSVRNLPRQRPDQVAVLDDVLYLFFARNRDDIGIRIRDDTAGQEVWATDGRSARLVAEISDFGFAADELPDGSLRTAARPFYSFSFGDKVYFPADDQLSSSLTVLHPTRFNNYGVWQTDGTPDGTRPTGLTVQIEEGLVVNNKLYFIAFDEEGTSLHVATDAIENTEELGRFQFSNYDRTKPRLFAYGDRVYFHADDGSGMSLWSTDGVSAPIISVPPNQDRRDTMPGEILYDSAELTISAKHTRDLVELSTCPPLLPGCEPVQRFLVDLWTMRDGDTAPQFLTQVVDEPEFLATLDFDDPQNMWAQFVDNQVFFRMLTSRETGTQMRFLMHSIDLPDVADVHVSGDLDCNGSIGFGDFLVLSENFGRTVDAVWTDGDFNGDGVVDFVDFLALSANFGKNV